MKLVFSILAMIGIVLPQISFALPQGGNVVGGSASISTPSSTVTQINQSSNRAVIDWHSYNVAGNETVRYQQPNSSSITLNRINPSQGVSQIFGSIQANGHVWLVNPAGIWFAPGSYVNVSGLLATTSWIKKNDFMAGNYQFQDRSNFNGSIVNEGTIIVKNAGLVALVGSNVTNNGLIVANQGTVVLGASKKFTVDFNGDQLVNFQVGGEVANPKINQAGKIIANGGKVIMTAQTASRVLDTTINMSGVVEARSVGVHNGEIILDGGQGGVSISGKLIASGTRAGHKGGTIRVKARTIEVTNTAVIAAQGNAGGGDISIGSVDDANADFNTASINVDAGAKIDASAINSGTGGNVTLSANDNIEVDGNIFAKGGLTSGIGGNVLLQTDANTVDSEVALSGTIDASALGTNGLGGTVKLLGYNVGLFSNAVINTSGDIGGGEVLVGGNAHGTGPEPDANAVYMDPNAYIYSDALSNGYGGTVVLWSNQVTNFYGFISAKGGALGGNGGWVETSGKVYLDAQGIVDAAAPHGLAGSWLLDPTDVVISTATQTNITQVNGSPRTFNPTNTTPSPATINATNIINALNAGTSVKVTTTSSGSDPGNIDVDANISKTAGGDATLTLTADNTTGKVTINNPISATVGALTLNISGLSIDIEAPISTNGGSISATTFGTSNTINANITTAGGTLTATANGGSIGVGNNITINTGTGTLNLFGSGVALGTSDLLLTATTGAINIATSNFSASSTDQIGGTAAGTGSTLTIILQANTNGFTPISIGGTAGGTFGVPQAVLNIIRTPNLTIGAPGNTGLVTVVGLTQPTNVTGSLTLGSRDGVTFSGNTTLSIPLTVNSGTTIQTVNTSSIILNNGVVLNDGSNPIIFNNATGGAATGGSIILGTNAEILTTGNIAFTNGSTGIAGTITLQSGAEIISSGASSTVTLTNSSDGSSGAITLGSNAEISSASGDMSLTSGSDGNAGTIALGAGSLLLSTADITLNTDLLTTTATSQIGGSAAGTGAATNVIIVPTTSTRNISVNSTTGAGLGTNTLILTPTTLNIIDTKNLRIGNSGATSGNMVITAWSPGSNYVSSGVLSLDMPGTISGTLSLGAGTDLPKLLVRAGGAVTFTGSDIESVAASVGAGFNLTNAAGNPLSISSFADDQGTVTGITAASVSITTSGTSAAISQINKIVTTGIASFSAGANAISLTNGNNSFGGNVLLSNSGANNVTVISSGTLDLGASSIGSGTNSLTANSGNIVFANTFTSTGTLNLTANAGSIGATGTGIVNANILNATASTGISLANQNAISQFSATDNTSGNISLTNTIALTLNAITNSGTGSITINNGVASTNIPITIANTIQAASGAININDIQGTITETTNGAILSPSGGATSVSTTVGNITLNQSNDINSSLGSTIALATTGAGNISYNDISGATFGNISLGTGTLTLTIDSGGQSFNLLQAAGTSITQAAGGGAVSLQNPTGSIILTNSGNDFTGVVSPVVGSGSSASITDANTINLGALNIAGGGNLTVTANAGGTPSATGIIQSGAFVVSGISTFNAGAGAITLTNANNDFTGAVSLSTTGANNASITDTNAIVLGTSTLGQNLTVNASGNITENGILTVSGTSTFNAGAGAITLNTANNNFIGAVSLNNTGANNVSILDNTGGLILGNSSVGANLSITLNNNGPLSQATSTSISVPGTLTITGGTGALNLSNSGNLLTTLGAISGGALQIVDSAGGLSVAGAISTTSANITTAGGALSLASTSSINTSGAISLQGVGITQANGVTVNAGSGTINYNGTTGSITLNGGTITTTGNASLNATDATSSAISGNNAVITANTLTTNSSAGTSLTNTSNNVAIFNATNTTSGDIIFKDGRTAGLTVTGVTQSSTSNNVSLYNLGTGALTITGTIDPNQLILMSNGLISDSSQIVATSLITQSVGGTTIDNATNQINNYSGSNTGGGNIIVRNSNASDLSIVTYAGDGGSVTAKTGVSNAGTGQTIIQSPNSRIIIGSGAALTSGAAASATNAAIVLVDGTGFVNNSGSTTPFSFTNSGNYQIWGNARANDVLNSLAGYSFIQYNNSYPAYPSLTASNVPTAQSGLIYSEAPVINVTLTGPITKTYDGTTTATVATGNYSISGVETGDSVTLSSPLSASYDTANAGVNKLVTATGISILSALSGSTTVYGYTLGSSSASGNVGTINPATLTYTANTASRTYGAANPAFSGTVTGFVNGETIGTATTGTLAFTSPAISSSNVGLYAINGGGLTANNGNYVFVQAAGNATALTINPATLTYTANAASRTYGAANPAFSGTVTGFVLGQNQASATTGTLGFTSPAIATSNVGSYAINGGGLTANNGNYVFVQAAGNATALTITPATLTYTANTASRTYGAANPAFSGAVTGFVNGESISSATTGTLAFTSPAIATSNVGSYAINGSGLTANNGNYVFAQAAGNATALTITPATLTYTANTASRTYGAANPTFSGTITGFVNGESQGSATTGTLAFTSAAIATSNVGSYAINGSGLTANNGNYVFAQAAGNATALTITPATLTYTANTASRTYGAANPTLSGTITGFVNGESQGSATSGTLLFTTAATTNSNVGSYAINGTGLTANNGNYVFAQAAGNATALTITPATLTYTANTASRTYGAANPAFSGTVTGFVLGQSQASATTGTLAFTSPAIATSNVGSYAINGSGLTANNGNYVFAQAAGNATALTITPATLTYTANTASRTYGAANPAFSGNVTGFVNGETIGTATSGTLAFTSPATTASNVGSYAINGSGLTANNGNYTFIQAPSNATALTITPASLTYAADSSSRVYGDANPTFSGTVTGFVNGDNISSATTGTLAFTSPSTVTSDVGNYAINGSGLTANNGNYTFTQAAGNATALLVTQRPVTISGVSAQDKVFDGTTNATITGTPVANNVVNGDAITVSGTGTGTFAQSNVGTNIPVYINGYTLSGGKAGDYVIQLNSDNAQVTSSANITTAALDISLNANDFHITYGPAYVFTGTEFNTTLNGNPFQTTITSVTFTVAGMSGNNIVDQQTPVGTYTVTPSNAQGTDLSNYNITYTTGNVTVDPRPVTISNVTAQNKVYDGTTSATIDTSGATLGNVYGADDVTLSINSSSGTFNDKNVGNGKLVTIDGSFTLSGTSASNYEIANPPGTTTANITPASLTITADSGQTKVYGTANPSSYTYSTSGFVPGDNVANSLTGALTRDAGENVGNYTINQGSLSAVNYDITYNSAQFAITPASLTITANNASKTYGDTTTFAGTEFTTSGLVTGDSVSSVSLSSPGAVNTANVGSYAITGSNAQGSGLGNYTITYNNGTLTVGQKALTITANDASKTYGDTLTFAGTEFTSNGLVNGDTITSVSLASAGAAQTATVAGSPYAITASNAVGANVSNYAITYQDGNLTVTPKNITLTPNSTSKTYGDTVTFAGTEFSAPGLVNGDAITSVGLSSSGAPAVASVGSYDIVANPASITGSGLDNYNISYATGNLQVNPKTLTITANDDTKVYGQTSPTTFSGYTVNGLVNSDNVASVDLASAGSGATANVGNYDITPSNAAGSGLSNYSIQFNNGTLSVTPLGATITANSGSKVYGSTYTFNGTEFNVTGLINGDSVNTVTLNSAGAAATATVSGSPYAITASNPIGTGVGNYTFSFVNGGLTVTAKDLTITANNDTKVYGQTSPTGFNGYNVLGLVNSDSVSSVDLASSGGAATANVGNYAITPSNAVGSGLDNYNVIYTTTGTLNVTPASLTITANSSSKTYGNAVTYNGTEFTTSGLLNSDAVNTVSLSSTGAPATAGVGSYSVVGINAVGSGLGNYTITYQNGTLTVNPATLTITANSTSKTYGSTVSFAGTEFTTNGLVNTDAVSSVSLSSAGAVATAQVGGSPYSIVASNAVGSGLSNYTINYVNGNLTINPKALTVTANSTSKTYGDTVTFAGTEFSANGLVNSDSVSSVSLSSTGAAANAQVIGSPYSIVATNAVGSGLGNYTISYVNGNLTVNPKALTITANDGSKTYGTTTTFNGTEFTANGLVNSDSVSTVSLSSLGTPATANVGSYDIIASNANGSGLSNYTIAYQHGTLTVDPASLTITANSTSKTYGSTVTFAGTEFTTNGLVNSDSVSSVTLGSAGAAATANVAGSPYAITAMDAIGSGLSNYTINYVNGNLTVTPKALTVTANSTSKTYGDTVTFAGTEFSANGLVNSDSISSVSLSSTGAAANAQVIGSPYSIVATNAVGSGLDNYTINYVNGNLTVNPKALTITANDGSKTYGTTTTFNGTEFTANGLVNSDSVSTVSLSSAGTPATANVGSYDIIASNANGSGLSNYTIAYQNGTLTVDPASLTITANSTSKTYGSTVTFAGTEFTTNGLVNSDSVSSVTLGSAGAAATANVAGSPYAITAINAVGSGLSNYTINYVNGNLTINPKALTVSSNDASKVYGSTYNFSGTTGYTANGLVNGDTVSSVSLSSAGAISTANVAAYGITVSNAVGTGLTNYTITYASTGNLSVTPASLTITASGQSKVYDTTTYSGGNGVTYTGFVAGDSSSSLSGTLAYTGTSQGARNVGNYQLIPTGLSSGNYTITFVTGDLNITAAPIAVTGISASNRVYDATTNAIINTSGVTFTGVFAGDTVNYGIAAIGTFNNKNVGNNKPITISGITLSGGDAGNYALVYAPVTASITPATITTSGITANSKVYDGTTAATLNFSNASLLGVFAGDHVGFNTNAYSASFASANPGTNIDVSINSLSIRGADAGNYQVIEPSDVQANILPEANILPPTPIPLEVSAGIIFPNTYLGPDASLIYLENNQVDNSNQIQMLDCNNLDSKSGVSICQKQRQYSKLLWSSINLLNATITTETLPALKENQTYLPQEDNIQ